MLYSRNTPNGEETTVSNKTVAALLLNPAPTTTLGVIKAKSFLNDILSSKGGQLINDLDRFIENDPKNIRARLIRFGIYIRKQEINKAAAEGELIAALCQENSSLASAIQRLPALKSKTDSAPQADASTGTEITTVTAINNARTFFRNYEKYCYQKFGPVMCILMLLSMHRGLYHIFEELLASELGGGTSLFTEDNMLAIINALFSKDSTAMLEKVVKNLQTYIAVQGGFSDVDEATTKKLLQDLKTFVTGFPNKQTIAAYGLFYELKLLKHDPQPLTISFKPGFNHWPMYPIGNDNILTCQAPARAEVGQFLYEVLNENHCISTIVAIGKLKIDFPPYFANNALAEYKPDDNTTITFSIKQIECEFYASYRYYKLFIDGAVGVLRPDVLFELTPLQESLLSGFTGYRKSPLEDYREKNTIIEHRSAFSRILKLVHFNIRDGGTLRFVDWTDLDVLGDILQEMQTNHNVLIHCHAGLGRTGQMVAILKAIKAEIFKKIFATSDIDTVKKEIAALVTEIRSYRPRMILGANQLYEAIEQAYNYHLLTYLSEPLDVHLSDDMESSKVTEPVSLGPLTTIKAARLVSCCDSWCTLFSSLPNANRSEHNNSSQTQRAILSPSGT